MWLVVGLGNPGVQYRNTRHNVGFDAVDILGHSLSPSVSWVEKNKALLAKGVVGSERVTLLKPLTFMNLSGEAVNWALHYFKVEPSHLIVIHDEIDLDLGVVRVKQGGGEAGHNGLKSISKTLGTKDYARVRLGVGRPRYPGMEVADWVLSRFASEEQKIVGDMCLRGVEAIRLILNEGLKRAQNIVNSV